MVFKDRIDAGIQLAALLEKYKNSNAIVLGLARGGMVTAKAVSQELGLPLDVIVVRKIGAPYHEELAIGALNEDGIMVLNDDLIASLNIPKSYLKTIIEKEKKECAYRVKLYREHYPALDLKDKTVLLVDDGIATGATMEAAIKVARARGAKKVIVAVPVLPLETVDLFKRLADELVYCDAPEDFGAVGSFYENFTQVSHDEVIQILKDFSNQP